MVQELKLLKDFEKDVDWLDNNMDSLKFEYDQKFVAIRKGHIVAVGTFMEDMIKTLKLQKIDPSETLIQFISKVKRIL